MVRDIPTKSQQSRLLKTCAALPHLNAALPHRSTAALKRSTAALKRSTAAPCRKLSFGPNLVEMF
jgi:hypothetical protein